MTGHLVIVVVLTCFRKSSRRLSCRQFSFSWHPHARSNQYEHLVDPVLQNSRTPERRNDGGREFLDGRCNNTAMDTSLLVSTPGLSLLTSFASL